MITKGYIESVVGDSEVTVRCPIFDGIKGGNRFSVDLSSSPINTYPGISPNLKSGDVVFVGFEENNRYKPVVLGYLCNSNSDTFVDISVNSMEADSVTLNGSVSIGDVTNDEIFCLEGLSEPVIDFFDSTSRDILEHKSLNADLLKKINGHAKKLDLLKTNIEAVESKTLAFKKLLGEITDTTEETISGMINVDGTDIQKLSDLIGQVPEGATIRQMLDEIETLCGEISTMLEEASNKLGPSSSDSSDSSDDSGSSDSPSFGSSDMMSRAERIVNVQWKANSSFKKWNSSSDFEEGKTYTGMPYSMFSFGYSFDDWKKHSDENVTHGGDIPGRGFRSGPKYGSCCSDFVSEVVGLPSIIRTCSGLASSSFFTKLTGEDAKIDKIQAGDVMLADSGGHVMWVGSVSGDTITIYEQTPPVAKKTKISKAGSTSPDGYLNYGGQYSTILRH